MKKNIPKNSIIIANHPSILDPFIIHYFCLFKFHFKPLIIAGKWAWRKRKVKLIAKFLGGKVVLNNSIGIKQSLRYLKNGGSILIFPEGTLSKYTTKIYPGFNWLAKQSKTDIYPIIIHKKGLIYRLELKDKMNWWDKNTIDKFKKLLSI